MANKKFWAIESAASAVLLLTAAAALLAANLFDTGYLNFSNSLKPAVNHYLIAIFFFAVGQEIKNEGAKSLALPAFAALGGMIVPGIIFKVINGGSEWVAALPTDIALVVGATALLGKRIRPELRIFLLTLALSDDLLSILLISIRSGFNPISLAPTLGAAALGFLIPMKIDLQKVSEFVVVPAFILANFGFKLIGPDATAYSLAISRVAGKTIGIALFAFIAIKIGAKTNLSLREIAAGGALAGMGLTVALYLVDTDQVKIGLLMAIILSFLVARAIAPENQISKQK